MNKLEVKTNKKLILKQVLIKELRDIPIEQLDSETKNFHSLINLLNVQTFGPLITKNYGTNIHDDGSITTSYDLMVQAHDYKMYKKQFKVVSQLQCEHCAYIRFQGESDNMQYAYTKLNLFFFENDLADTGVVYNVFLSNHSENMVLDIFKPVEML